MPGARISGLAVTELAAGFVLFWSGLKNSTLQDTLTSFAHGQLVTATPESAPAVGISDAPATAAAAGTGGSTAAAPSGVGSPGAVNGCTASQTASNKQLGQLLAAAYGWGTGAEWNALNGVVLLESGWCNKAQNPTSTAYGIGQFLDTTWAAVGATKSSDPATQITAMLRYIKERYGTPEKAYSFHIANGYY